MSARALAFFLLFCMLQVSWLQLLPGIGPRSYCLYNEEDDDGCYKFLEIYVNALYSDLQLSSREYSQSGFCSKNLQDGSKMSFGQRIFGDDILSSPYMISIAKKETCRFACNTTYDETKLNQTASLIKEGYKHEWAADDLPVLFEMPSPKDSNKPPAYSFHFPLGCAPKDSSNKNAQVCPDAQCDMHPDKYCILNHVDFKIFYVVNDQDSKHRARIVNITVSPTSNVNCMDLVRLPVVFGKTTKMLNVEFSYGVTFQKVEEFNLHDRYRYIYQGAEDGTIQWLKILFSVLVLLTLTGASAYIFIRTIRRDILRYTELLNSGFDAQDEYGWKMLQADVFRSPKYPMLLSISVGSGLQIVIMCVTALFFAFLQFFSPNNRGSFITYVIVSYVLLGILSGFVSASIYKFFEGQNWKTCVIGTAILHPGILFFSIFCINTVLHIAHVHSAIPYLSLFAVFAMWTLLSVPLTFIGGIYGFKRKAIKAPVKKNMIPRSIPRQRFVVRPMFCIFFGGFCCFLAIYMQLNSIIRSIWQRFMYVLVGLPFCLLILLIVCAEVAIILCYIHLRSEDYRWQWRSFFTTGMTAFPCFCYAVYYYTQSPRTNYGPFIYFSYTLVMLYMLFLATGAIGFIACFFVLLKMFSSIKVD